MFLFFQLLFWKVKISDIVITFSQTWTCPSLWFQGWCQTFSWWKILADVPAADCCIIHQLWNNLRNLKKKKKDSCCLAGRLESLPGHWVYVGELGGCCYISKTFDSLPKTTWLLPSLRATSYKLHPAIIQHKLSQQIMKAIEQSRSPPSSQMTCWGGGRMVRSFNRLIPAGASKWKYGHSGQKGNKSFGSIIKTKQHKYLPFHRTTLQPFQPTAG